VWLFTQDDGALLDSDHVAWVFGKILKQARLPNHRVYDSRHTYASLLLASGAPITYVSEQLGHSSPAPTLRYYARWVPTRGRRWVDALDRAAGRTARGTDAQETSGSAIVEPESGTIEEAASASV
jgi:integrase